ncbi:hypothetical protein B296_00028083 [Ensete ventricosum]|uniref:Uncharacterized protein n=1 Tax=Ensete ventricosum TaxID=4639 RepID=A0A426Z0E1_ENSVE|nr:hypothetical protein B296_00028083 [Ensete ventricosum]
MFPLRFPNSGIRAKVVHAKIGFKLCVMIFNRVEPFYVFVAAISKDGSTAYGLCCLLAGVVDCGQALVEAVDCHQGPLQWVARLRQELTATRN